MKNVTTQLDDQRDRLNGRYVHFSLETVCLLGGKELLDALQLQGKKGTEKKIGSVFSLINFS